MLVALIIHCDVGVESSNALYFSSSGNHPTAGLCNRSSTLVFRNNIFSMEKVIQPCPQCKTNTWSTIISGHAWQCHTCGYIREEEMWKDPDPAQWIREQGSKRDQGIETPKSPRFRKTPDGKLRCKCLYRGTALYDVCQNHTFGLEVARKLQIGMELGWKMKQEEKNKPVEPEPQAMGGGAGGPAKKDPFPIERVNTSESVQVELITPGENNDTKS